MPHKRNPEKCEQVVVLARLARAAANTSLEAMLEEHERDSRGLRLEWAAVPEVSHYTLCALSIVRTLLEGLHVHETRMAEHARQAADQVCTEALMLALGRHLGKQSAYNVVYELSQRAQDEGGSLFAYAAASSEVTAHLDVEELRELFDPAQQVGEARELVDAAVARSDRAFEAAR